MEAQRSPLELLDPRPQGLPRIGGPIRAWLSAPRTCIAVWFRPITLISGESLAARSETLPGQTLIFLARHSLQATALEAFRDRADMLGYSG